MVKFTFGGDGDPTSIGLGISRENVNRLIQGKPIRVSLREMKDGLTINGDIMIYFAETEQGIVDAIAEFIGPQTKVTIDPRLKSKLT